MTFAVVWTLVATAIVGFLSSLFGEAQSAAFDWSRAGLFAFTAILAVWAILTSSKLWEGTAVAPTTRRMLLTLVGAGVGACAFWLDDALLADLAYENAFPESLIQRVGSHPLLNAAVQPTLAGYMVFFAALFGVRRWWWQADSFRSARFRVSTLLFTALLAFLLPAAFAFPQSWATCWAVVISAVAQLSAPFVSMKERAALVEGRAA
jgi:hypothetical protein